MNKVSAEETQRTWRRSARAAVRPVAKCSGYPGRDAITRHMVALSTYLGHSTVAHTHWYLEAIPDLMRDIADQTEQMVIGGQS